MIGQHTALTTTRTTIKITPATAKELKQIRPLAAALEDALKDIGVGLVVGQRPQGPKSTRRTVVITYGTLHHLNHFRFAARDKEFARLVHIAAVRFQCKTIKNLQILDQIQDLQDKILRLREELR